MIEDKIIVFASHYSKKDDLNRLFGIVYNTKGRVESDWKEIATISSNSSKNAGDFVVLLSRDTTKILIAMNMPYEKKGKEKFRMLVLDKQLKEVWDKNFVLPFTERQTRIRQFTLDNEGIAYMLADVGPASKKEAKKAKKSKEDPNVKYILSFNPTTEEIKEYEVSLQKKSIIFSSFHLDSKENIILTGFYSDNTNKKGGGLSGSFFIRMPKGTDQTEVANTREFDKDFVAKLIGEKRAKKGREISTSYLLKHVIQRHDGSVVLIAEQFYLEERCRTSGTGPLTVTHCVYIYHHNSIIHVGIDPNGEIIWNGVIPKYTAHTDPSFLSYGIFVTDKNIHLIFNDSKKNFDENGQRKEKKIKPLNLRKSLTVDAMIDTKGEVTYEVLFDNKKLSVLPRPSTSFSIGNNGLILWAYKKKKSVLGKITFTG